MKKWVFIGFNFFALSTNAAESPLRFDQAIEAILARSTKIATKKHHADAVEASNLPKRLFFLPTIAIETKEGRSEIDKVRDEGRSLQATSKINLFRFGGDYYASSAAKSENERERFLLDSETLVTEQDAVDALVSQVSNLLKIDVLRKIVGLQDDLLKILDARYRKGLTPRQESDKLIVDRENARARLMDLEIEEASSRARLISLLGHANIEKTWPWKASPSNKKLVSLLQSQPETSHRPDVRAAQIGLEAEDAHYQEKVRTIFPSIDASFSYGYTQGIFGGGDAGATGWTGILALTIPLFDRLENYANAKAQAATRSEAEVRLEETLREAKREWLSAKKTVESSIEAVRLREKTLGISRNLYSDGLKRFQLGRINANDFALDQNRLYESELFAIEGNASAHTSIAAFCHSIGLRLEKCLGD